MAIIKRQEWLLIKVVGECTVQQLSIVSAKSILSSLEWCIPRHSSLSLCVFPFQSISPILLHLKCHWRNLSVIELEVSRSS